MGTKQLAVRVYDLGGIQIARVRFDAQIPVLEIADPPAEGSPMQWVLVSGREELTRLAHGILEFLIDYPADDDEGDTTAVPIG